MPKRACTLIIFSSKLNTAQALTEDKTETDLLKRNQFRDINGKRYASYPGYERRLSEIISNVSQTTDIDSLISIRKQFKVIKIVEYNEFNLLTINTIDDNYIERKNLTK